METLDLLEWPRVCRAVASFAATSLAKEQLQVLEIPATRDASEALLELTSAGVELISLLGGPFELGALRTLVVREFSNPDAIVCMEDSPRNPSDHLFLCIFCTVGEGLRVAHAQGHGSLWNRGSLSCIASANGAECAAPVL